MGFYDIRIFPEQAVQIIGTEDIGFAREGWADDFCEFRLVGSGDRAERRKDVNGWN
jgi:hypothetical protein